jgi:hypothetical protein
MTAGTILHKPSINEAKPGIRRALGLPLVIL